jgi:CheY-like chemotaxis protein
MNLIDQQAGHATNLIQQILDFGRRAVLERRPLDLAALTADHVKLLKRTLPESINIRLDYRLGEYTVNADPTRMQQMVTNLALNARDAMREGGELRIILERIEIQPGDSPILPEIEPGDWIRVSVSDSGMGIPADVLPHIFEPFFTTKSPLGSGLGLAQVHGIVGQHGGRIDVDTEVGVGTTFTIYLPAHVFERSGAPAPDASFVLKSGQGQLILVVEDDAVVRKALVESLAQMGYRCQQAADGQQAMAILERPTDEISLVLSDVIMPGMSGVALLQAIRKKGLMMPVVMLTGHPLEKQMEELRERENVEWLPKPPDLKQLANALARALDRD